MLQGASNAAQAQAAHGAAGDLVGAARIDHVNSRVSKLEARHGCSHTTITKGHYATMEDFDSNPSVAGTAPCTENNHNSISSRAVVPPTLSSVKFSA